MNNLKISLFILSILLMNLTSCELINDEEKDSKGEVSIEITDAPIDDAKISGAFVTITEIKADGKSIEGFNKTTLDLMAYQNGATKLLSNTNLDIGSYNNITLVLDEQTDANGNAPGCYVFDVTTNTKHQLTNVSNQIVLNHNYNIEKDNKTNLVIDFDLRKCIKRAENSSNSNQYDFVSTTEMQNGIRVVNKNSVGIIKGNCNQMLNSSDKIVVYAYKKGTFNQNTETQGQGQSNIEFANAVSSATVDINGNYELHFLEEGEYELHYCTYEENNSNQMELSGMLIVDVFGSLNLNSIRVNSSTTLEVNVIATGVINL